MLETKEKQKEISEFDAKIIRFDYLPSLGVSAQYSNYWVNDIYEEVNF